MATMTLRPWRRARSIAAIGSAVALLALAACSSGSGATSTGGTPSGELQILVSSADASDAAFRAVNTAFEKAYPGVTVTFATVPNDNYPVSKASRLTAGNVDLLVVKNLVEVPSYAKGSESDDARLAASGGYVDLTNEPFMKNFTPSVLSAEAFAGKQYAVPTGLSYSTGMYYNKKIFADNGIAVPTTWTELVAAADKLKAAGITPFGIGGKDSWPAGLPMLAAVNGEYPDQASKQALAKGLWDGSVKLTDAKPQTVMDRTATILADTESGMAGIVYADIPAGFARGDYAMIPDGTWNEPTIKAAVAGAFDYGYIPIPTSDTSADNANLNGKIELQLGIPSSAKNKTAALAWLTFFSDPTNYAQFVKQSGFSPAEPDVGTTDFLKGISAYTSNFELAWEQVWTGNPKAGQAALFPFNYPELKPLGTLDPTAAAKAAQADWSAGL